MSEIINIGSRREVFWDNTMLDTSRTRTTAVLHEPIKRECVITFDESLPVTADGCHFIKVLQDGDIYRMYVHLQRTFKHEGKKEWSYSPELYFESKDGIHWEAPKLGICEYHGNKDNNILFDYNSGDNRYRITNGFRVMIDPRPECPPEEKYKALADIDMKLHVYTSSDAIHFKYLRQLDLTGIMDSVNTLLYDPVRNKFRCFFRNYHPNPNPMQGGWYRDIHTAESEDLINWSEDKILSYDTYMDWQLYTNAISVYPRAPHIMVGFPARYVERPTVWTSNFEAMKGSSLRHERMEKNTPRTASAITEGMFMTSRDGYHWTRYNNAFLRPGPENGYNWVYGDNYISAGIVETKSLYKGCDNELSFYTGEKRWSGEAGEIYRYTIRLDGYVSQHADWDSAWDSPTLVTKKFIFEGNDLYINFATSAYGHMQIKLRADDGTWAESGEIFGDSTHRKVIFDEGSPLSELSGKPVTMEIKMRDADIYSFKFE